MIQIKSETESFGPVARTGKSLSTRSNKHERRSVGFGPSSKVCVIQDRSPAIMTCTNVLLFPVRASLLLA